MNELLFVGSTKPVPEIIEYSVKVPSDTYEDIRKQLVERYGEDVDFEVSKIYIRVYK